MKKLLKKALAFFFAGAVAIGGALPVSEIGRAHV